MERAPRRNLLAVALVVVGALVAFGGIGLLAFGGDAEVTKPRNVEFRARIKVPDKRIADLPKPGDVLYSDTGGIPVGQIVSTEVTHAIIALGDKAGGIHANPDPLNWQMEAVIRARGRIGGGMVVLDTQVLQVGQSFSIISQRYYLPNATVVSIDVQ
jgi:hypothetical protein